jgi:hypothetical protein
MQGYYLGEVAHLRDLEGTLLGQQLVRQHTDGPDVHRVVVVALRDHFRGEVEGSAAEGESQLAARVVDRPSEVAYLDCVVLR